jgi:GNAT superfamily N-acetyltransferase
MQEEKNMELLRANRTWERAGAYYVRIEAMVKGFQIPMNQEFDENDGEDTEYVVAIDGVLPVGTCRLYRVDDTTAKIERVAVIEEYRGQGVGSLVIKEAEKWLSDKGIRKVIITSRDVAVEFYEKLGYKADWSRKKDNGVFTIVYTEKNL